MNQHPEQQANGASITQNQVQRLFDLHATIIENQVKVSSDFTNKAKELQTIILKTLSNKGPVYLMKNMIN